MEGIQTAADQQNETAIIPQMQVHFTQFNPDKDIIATADVKIGNLLTVRNVKVKEDDYGYNVVMPKTQMKEDGKSSSQVILRWNLQKGVVVIPGSSNPEHIQENTELYDFELTDDEMNQINALDRGEKHDWY